MHKDIFMIGPFKLPGHSSEAKKCMIGNGYYGEYTICLAFF